LNVALRTFLRQIVGKPECDLNGLWSNNEISVAVCLFMFVCVCVCFGVCLLNVISFD